MRSLPLPGLISFHPSPFWPHCLSQSHGHATPGKGPLHVLGHLPHPRPPPVLLTQCIIQFSCQLPGAHSLQVGAPAGAQRISTPGQRLPLPRQPQPLTEHSRGPRAISAHCGLPLMARSQLRPRALPWAGRNLVPAAWDLMLSLAFTGVRAAQSPSLASSPAYLPQVLPVHTPSST